MITNQPSIDEGSMPTLWPQVELPRVPSVLYNLPEMPIQGENTQVNKIRDEKFLAWLAGFWEGEGCLLIKKRGIEVRITQARRDILELITQTLGFGRVYSRNREPRDTYDWVVSNAPTVEKFFQIILPYLKFRKEEVIEKIQTNRARMKLKTWAKEEDALIREFYGKVPLTKIAKVLGRPHSSTVNRATKRLGLYPLGKGHWRKKNNNVSIEALQRIESTILIPWWLR